MSSTKNNVVLKKIILRTTVLVRGTVVPQSASQKYETASTKKTKIICMLKMKDVTKNEKAVDHFEFDYRR